MSNDNRRRPRKQLNVPALIDIGNNARLRMCTVIDVSESGARLAVEDIECLPDKFSLTMPRLGQTRRSCIIVWRRHDEIGIEFIAAQLATGLNSEGVDAVQLGRGNLESLTEQLTRDRAKQEIVGVADDRPSARLLRKVSALLAQGLRCTRHLVSPETSRS